MVPEEVVLSQKTMTMNAGETKQITASVLPGSASQSLAVTTTDAEVASGSGSDVIAGQKAGSATLTYTADNGVKATLKVTVKAVETP